MTGLRTISYGGGVQSTALVVLAAQGEIDFQFALMANVGDDSEHPATLKYVREVMTPWLADKPVQLEILSRVFRRGPRAGQVETLYSRLYRDDLIGTPIPVRLANGAPAPRGCTADFKIRVIARWLKENGASAETPATVAIGISTDEYQRAGRGRDEPHELRTYPLLDLGLSRVDCQRIIAEAGLPVPPKSACYFCPFHRPQYWSEMRRDTPELFEKAADLEDYMNAKLADADRPPVYLTRYLEPLRDAIPVAQPTLFTGDSWASMDNDGECDDGYCFV